MAEIEGMKALSVKLNKLGASMAGKTLKQATVQAITPVKRKMRASIPVGKRGHSTFKGRFVAPGFSRRNIKHKAWLDRSTGSAVVAIGVDEEAYYAVQFVDRGTKNMSARPWFRENFFQSKGIMVARLGDVLRKKIKKIAAKR